MSATLSDATTVTGTMSLQGSSAPDCGDFVDDYYWYEVEESAEPIESYHEEISHYPICIGDIIAQTYRIEHKLGHGGFSTVWMAPDVQKKRDVPLKIMVHGDAEEYELNM